MNWNVHALFSYLCFGVSIHALLIIASKVSFRDNSFQKFTIFHAFYLTQKRRKAIKELGHSDKFQMLIPNLDLDVLEVKKLRTVKKLLQLRILNYFSKRKTEACDQKTWSVSDKF